MKKQVRSVIIAIVILSLASAGFAFRGAKELEPRSAPVQPIVVAF